MRTPSDRKWKWRGLFVMVVVIQLLNINNGLVEKDKSFQ